MKQPPKTELFEVFEKFGLSKRAGLVYIALLRQDSMRAAEIIRTTGIPRQLVYEALQELEHFGFVTRAPVGKQRYAYSPTSPDILRDLADKQVARIEKLIPFLHSLRGTARAKSEISVQLITGWPAIRAYWREFGMNKMTKEVVDVSICSIDEWYKADYDFVEKFWEPNKIKKGIRTRLIATTSWIADLQRKHPNYDVRILPRDEVFHGDITVYGDTVHFLTLEKKEIHMVVIVSHEIAKTNMQLFEILWKKAG